MDSHAGKDNNSIEESIICSYSYIVHPYDNKSS